jgi:hypothetical protein
MPNGDVYQGFLKNAKKNGKGILTLKNGKILNGCW